MTNSRIWFGRFLFFKSHSLSYSLTLFSDCLPLSPSSFFSLSMSPSKSKKNGHLKRKGYFLPVGKLHLKGWGFITCCRWSFHPFTPHHDFFSPLSSILSLFSLSFPSISLFLIISILSLSHTHSLLIPYYCNDVSSSLFHEVVDDFERVNNDRIIWPLPLSFLSFFMSLFIFLSLFLWETPSLSLSLSLSSPLNPFTRLVTVNNITPSIRGTHSLSHESFWESDWLTFLPVIINPC